VNAFRVELYALTYVYVKDAKIVMRRWLVIIKMKLIKLNKTNSRYKYNKFSLK
jgi:hypothetical protein